MRYEDMVRLEGDDPISDLNRSRHRRELAENRRVNRKRLRRLFLPLAILGWFVAIQNIMQPDPPDFVAMFAALLSVPYLSTFDLS